MDRRRLKCCLRTLREAPCPFNSAGPQILSHGIPAKKPSSPRTLAWNCLAHYFGLHLAFLVGGISKLRPIVVYIFRPKYRLDIVIRMIQVSSCWTNNVLEGDREADLIRERNPPHMPPVTFKKRVLRRVCYVRSKQTGRLAILPILNK
ncbi:hypothetical protein J6590_037742 [Homalodisca vitripennis]|nr:hypothetical protein J6590_037742 [Homalodisca vitripennis]